MGLDVRLAAVIGAGAVGLSLAAAPVRVSEAPRARPPQAATAPAPAQAAGAVTAAFESYTESIPDTAVKFDMVAVPGGTVKIGSPASEPGRGEDEGPQVTVKVGPFWMGRLEVTWAEFDLYAFAKKGPPPAGTAPAGADAISRPTPPYADESWGFGK